MPTIQYVFNPFTGTFDAINTSTSNVTSFTLANNTSSFTDITGFLVNPSTNQAFTAEISVNRSNASYTTLVDAEDTAFYANLGTGLDNSVISVIEQADSTILVGGFFTTFNGNARSHIIKLNSDGTEDTAFYTNLGSAFNGVVETIAEQANAQIVIGGGFTSFNGNTTARLVRLNADGTQDTTFSTNLGTGFDVDVSSICIQTNQQILVGGAFTHLNGSPVNYVVRLNSDGTLDSTFATNIGTGADNPVVYVLQQANAQIVIGGSFTTFNGNGIESLVRLNSDGTADSTFSTNIGTGFNSDVNIIAEQANSQLVIGGVFTTFNGNTRNHLIRLNSDGTEDTTFYTNLGTAFNNEVTSIALQQTQIVVGGGFTTFNGNTRNYLIRLNSDGTEDTAFYTSLNGGFSGSVFSVFTQTNGQLLIGGNYTSFGGNTRDYLIRFEVSTTFPAAELLYQGTVRGVYSTLNSAWFISGQDGLSNSTNTSMDSTGLVFNMTNVGQMQYTSSNLPGTPTAQLLKFEILGL